MNDTAPNGQPQNEADMPTRQLQASLHLQGQGLISKLTAWHQASQRTCFLQTDRSQHGEVAEPHVPSFLIQLSQSHKSFLFPWRWVNEKVGRKAKTMTLMEILPHKKRHQEWELSIRFLALLYYIRYSVLHFLRVLQLSLSFKKLFHWNRVGAHPSD